MQQFLPDNILFTSFLQLSGRLTVSLPVLLRIGNLCQATYKLVKQLHLPYGVVSCILTFLYTRVMYLKQQFTNCCSADFSQFALTFIFTYSCCSLTSGDYLFCR